MKMITKMKTIRELIIDRLVCSVWFSRMEKRTAAEYSAYLTSLSDEDLLNTLIDTKVSEAELTD